MALVGFENLTVVENRIRESIGDIFSGAQDLYFYIDSQPYGYLGLFSFLLLVFLVLAPSGKYYRSKDKSVLLHKKNIGQAKVQLNYINHLATEHDGAKKQFYFIRYKVDPFVFEEMIMAAFANRDIRTRKERRYTGDGGVDGRIFLNGKLVLCQMKRWRSHINLKDIKNFEALCHKHNSKGLFIHSGRTGEGCKEYRSDSLDIISGIRLLDLLCQRPIEFFPNA